VFSGYRFRFHMYSLTGKVTNPAAWKMTLKGADGVVVVADAAPEMVPENRESISRLREFLAAYGVGLHDIPCVLQLNRVGSSGRLSWSGAAAELDVPDMRTCFSEAGSGKGVLEALSLISRDIMDRIGQDDSLRTAETSIPPETATHAGGSPDLLPLDSDEGLLKPEPDESVAEEASLSARRPAGVDAGEGPLQVALAGEGAVYSEGTVRIPLEITLGGAPYRLVVSIAIEQA
jgi:hypothetical protein